MGARIALEEPVESRGRPASSHALPTESPEGSPAGRRETEVGRAHSLKSDLVHAHPYDHADWTKADPPDCGQLGNRQIARPAPARAGGASAPRQRRLGDGGPVAGG